MRKYWFAQCKRLGRLLLWVAPAMAVLAVCLGLGGKALVDRQQSQEAQQPFPIGLVGLPEDGMLRTGLSLITDMDDLGVALEIVELSAQQAPAALEQGQVKAYVVIPENFAREASRGNLLTIAYVTTPDATGMAALFQQEITGIIAQVLLDAEKASFGAYDALAPHVGHDQANQATRQLSLELAEFVFIRNRATVTVNLGLGDSPSFGAYMACGLAVAALLLMALGFGPLTVQQHVGVNQMLCSRGCSGLKQSLADYLVLLMGMTALVAAGLGLGACFVQGIRFSWLWRALPVVAMVAAMAYACFSLTGQLHSALLLYFFLAMGLALVCGCLYPAWFFPEAVQRLAAWLPAGVARRQLAAGTSLLPLLAYTLGFWALGSTLRLRRMGTQEGQL